jgi:hypothetical protein
MVLNQTGPPPLPGHNFQIACDPGLNVRDNTQVTCTVCDYTAK